MSDESEIFIYRNIIFWYKKDTCLLHRENGPAIEYPSGTKAWYKNGKLHRDDGPAVELYDGTKYWYLHGQGYDVNSLEELLILNIIK